MRRTGRPKATARAEAEPWEPFVTGLRGFLARRVPASDVDDVTQDVLIRLHRAAPDLAAARHPEAWIHTVARRAVADYYRSRRPAPAALDVERLPATADTEPASTAEFDGEHGIHEEVLSWLRPLAETLPASYRDPLVMADFEGRKQKQVAETLGLSLSGAKSRIQRARVMLGEALRRCCDVEFGPGGRAVDFRRKACDC